MLHKFLCLVFCLNLSGVLLSQSASPDLPVVINNKKSDKHIRIPGSRISLVIPKEFQLSLSYIGVSTKDSKTGIEVMDLVGGNFEANTKDFSKETFEKKGARVYEYKELLFDGYSAKFIHMMGSTNTKSYGLVFGDSTFSIMLQGYYPDTDEQTGALIRASILSGIYDKSVKIDPQETARFKVEEAKSDYRFLNFKAGMFCYSRCKIKTPEPQTDSILVFVQMPYHEGTSLKTMSEQQVLTMQKYGLINFKIEKAIATQVNGCEAFESEISGYLRGEQTRNYVLMVRIKPSLVVLIQGTSKGNDEQNIAGMKKLASTIKPK